MGYSLECFKKELLGKLGLSERLSDTSRTASWFSYNYNSEQIHWEVIRTQMCGPQFKRMLLPFTFCPLLSNIMAENVQFLSTIIF